MQLSELELNPCTLLSHSLSEIMQTSEEDPSFVEMIARILYPAGKYCSDTTHFDMLYARVRRFSGKKKK